MKYPAKSWADVPLVTDLSVRHNTVPDARRRFDKVLDLLKRNNPRAFVGRYISGARVESSMKQYPQEAIRASQIPSDWLRLGTNRVDLSNFTAADLFADLIVAATKDPACHDVFLDNIVHPSMMRGWVAWKDTCRFLRHVKRGVNQNASLLIANLALAPWSLSDEDVAMLSDAVDGMSFEMSFHWRARGNQERTRRLITAYRAWLSAGKIVVFIPVVHGLKSFPEADRELQKAREMRLLAGFAMMIREPGDRLFVSSPFWKPEPDWAHWPESFGNPIGERRLESDNVLIRRFEHGTLTVDVKSKTVTRTPSTTGQP